MTSTFRSAGPWLAVLSLVCAAAPSAHAGDRYALLVGVKVYNKNELHNLAYTENDVTELAQVLRDAGYKRVVLMTQSAALAEGDSDLQPTSDNIRAQLKGVLDGRKPDDTVLIAFSGHGVQLKKTGKNYFCPMDARQANPDSLISLPDVYDQLSACKAGAKVMFVDACRNDPQANLDKGGGRPEVELPSNTRPQDVPAPGGVAVVYSCSATQTSFESDRLKHGIFFNFVIEGLKGKAANERGEVGLSGLVQYVTDQVPDQVKSDVGPERTQVPQAINNITGSLTLLTVKVTVHPTPPDGGEKSARARIDQGREHLKQHENEQALASFGAAIELGPKNAEGYVYRAEALYWLHEYDKALENCNQAVDLAQESDVKALAYAIRSKVYLARGQEDEGGADAARAVGLAPDSAQANIACCLARRVKGELDKAVAYGQKAVRLEPTSAEAQDWLACAYDDNNDRAKALAGYNEAIRLDPKFARAFRHRGFLSFPDEDKEIADFAEAVRLDPKDDSAFCELAACWVVKKDLSKAKANFDEAIRVNPKNDRAFYLRGLMVWEENGDLDKAMADYDEAIRINPKESMSLYHRGNIWKAKGDLDKAIADYTEAIRFHAGNGDSINALLARADAYDMKGEHEKANADRERYNKK